MRWYLDSSVALHAVLPWGDPRARRWLDGQVETGESAVFASSLLHLEITRALRRERMDVTMVRPLTDRVNLVSIDDGVLRVAAAIEPHVKALDAIHLATCTMMGTAVTLVTHDAQMAAVAATLGIDSLDPLAG